MKIIIRKMRVMWSWNPAISGMSFFVILFSNLCLFVEGFFFYYKIILLYAVFEPFFRFLCKKKKEGACIIDGDARSELLVAMRYSIVGIAITNLRFGSLFLNLCFKLLEFFFFLSDKFSSFCLKTK
jgi:hypothetical protein